MYFANDVALNNLEQTVSADPAILDRGSLMESDDEILKLDEDEDIKIISTDAVNQNLDANKTVSTDPVVVRHGPVLKSGIGTPIVRAKNPKLQKLLIQESF